LQGALTNVILDPKQVKPTDMYKFLIGIVVPRPIAFVSTVSASGQFNLAPFSFFNALSSEPPLVGIAITDRTDDPKDTLRNVRETNEFVINVVSEDLLERMVQTSGEWPRETDEFAVSGLTPIPALRVRAPRVAESPAHLECRLHREISLGNCIFVVGEVLLAEVHDRALTDGRVDPTKLRAVGRLGGDGYSRLGEVVRVPRPKATRAGGKPLA
jgi:flavin reductase (DIM6/NTAB) family NADH-FMN oxidoreductase RutF